MSRTSHSEAFAEALVSAAAHPELPEDGRIFAPFIGCWDLVVRWFDGNGAVSRQEKGEWHFSWVLEGRAIQDVWIVPPRTERTATPADYEYGTSLRFYDGGIGAWQSIWIGPMHRVIRTFIARRVEGRVVLETTESAHPRMRWSFADISPNAFSWRNEIWEEGGGWRIQQTFEATRAGIRPADSPE